MILPEDVFAFLQIDLYVLDALRRGGHDIGLNPVETLLVGNAYGLLLRKGRGQKKD